MSIANVKRAQKESLLFREISQLFLETSLDDPRLKDFFVNRVQLSPDKSVCTIYFYSAKGEEYFNEILNVLIAYKSSLRKALAGSINLRYTPELVFKFDKHYEKQQRIEQLLEEVKTEREQHEHSHEDAQETTSYPEQPPYVDIDLEDTRDVTTKRKIHSSRSAGDRSGKD